MKNIKLIAFDIDGTLLARGQKQLSERLKNALNTLHQKNIILMIATGRCSYFIQEPILKQPFDYYATINGQLVLDRHFKVIQSNRLNFEEATQLIHLCKKHDISVGAKMEDAIYVYHNYDHFQDIYLQHDRSKKHFLIQAENQPLLPKAPYGVFMIGNENIIERFESSLNSLVLSHAYPSAIEVFDRNIGKQDGIQAVLDKHHLTWQECMVFGDAHNDLCMFEKARYSIAMGNSPDHVKNLAGYTTLSAQEDGVAVVLEQLIKEVNQ